MNTLTIDIKTRSNVSIRFNGVFKYAQDKSTQPICVTVRKNYEPALIWLPPELRRPEIESISDAELTQMLNEAEIIQAYDITTEFALWECTLRRLYPWFPKVPIRKLSCIAARAAYLGMRHYKNDLITVLCGQNPGDPEKYVKKKFSPNDHLTLKELSAFITDCIETVGSECELSESLLELPDIEREIWQIGLLMNYHGIPISQSCLSEKIAAEDLETKLLMEEFSAVTGIRNPMNNSAFSSYALAHGIPLKSLDEEELHKTIQTLPNGIMRRVLEIRSRIVQIRNYHRYAILLMLNQMSTLQGLWQYYGTPAGESTLKYLPGIQVLDDLVQHSPKKLLYIGEIPDLKMKIRNWLLQDRYLSSAVYARDLLEMTRKAMREPGNAISFGRIKIASLRHFLKITLPSGRDIFIYGLRLANGRDLYCQVQHGRQVAEKQISGQYLLSLIENSLARDIMWAFLRNAFNNDFFPILIASNEIVVEYDRDEEVFDSFDAIMQRKPEWCKDIPLQAVSYLGSSWKKRPEDKYDGRH